MASFGGMPAESDGLVVASAGGGIIAAADASTGALVWLSRYDQEDAPYRLSRRYVQPGGWQTPTPLIADGVVYATPPDSDFLYAIALGSGKLLCRLERGDHQYLIGVRDGRIYLAGKTVACVAATGETEWETALPRMAIGRPALAGHVLHLPLEGEMLFLDAATGRQLARVPWDDWKATHKPTWTADLDSGDLLIAGGKLLIATPYTINVFAPDQPRPELERALAADPEQPAVHFALGKEWQWEGDPAAAAEAFEKTLELAARRPGGLGDTDPAEIHGRLSACYETLASRHEEAGHHDMALNAARAALRHAEPPTTLTLQLRIAALCAKLRRWPPAVEAYQQVLTAAPPDEPDWATARTRLDALLRQVGREPYAPFEAAATAALREGTEARLREVVRSYPNSLAAPRALLRLAARSTEGGAAAEARLWLHQLARDYPDSSQAPEAVYRLAVGHAREGGRAMARGALTTLRRTHPGWRATLDGQPASADLDIEAFLRAHGRPAPRPAAAPAQPPFTTRWTVDQTYGSSELYVAGAPAARDVVFLLVGRSFECCAVADGALRWADRPGWIGIHIADAVRPGGGVVIRGVLYTTPAQRAGLRNGDIIVAFEGSPVRNCQELIGACLVRRAGTKARLRFLRDGQPHEVSLLLGERPTQAQDFHLRPHAFVGLLAGKALVRRPNRLDAIRVEDGSRAWSAAIDDPGDGFDDDADARPSAAAPGLIALGDRRGRLVALDPDGGRRLWARQLDEPTLHDLAIWEHGVVVASSRPSTVRVLNPFDGRPRFHASEPRAAGAPAFALDTGPRLCYAMGSSLGCYEAGRPEALWTARIANFTSRRVWLAGPRVLAHGVDDRGVEVFECRELATGEPVWALALARGESLQEARVEADAVYAVTRRAGGTLVLRLDLSTGKIAWKRGVERAEQLDAWEPAAACLCLALSVADVQTVRRAELLALDKRTGEPRQRVPLGKGRVVGLTHVAGSLYAVVEGDPRPLMQAAGMINQVPTESTRYEIVRLAGPQ
jgi:outer membrane protein assembly factor BamB